jgi:hypothetical protein
MVGRFTLIILAILGLGSLNALAQTIAPADTAAASAGIALVGAGPAPIILNAASLAGLPVVEKDVTFQTSKGPSSGHYKGVLFWDVLQGYKAFDGLERNGELKKTFLVDAKDGYSIAFSVGEIHPDFGNTELILATEVDGKPVEGGIRVVVPGDRRGARAIHDIVKIELR